jgi:hypothetical protein
MVKKFTEVKDSGKRQAFNTGSQRDTDVGKGNPHLVAGEAFCKIEEMLKTRGLCYTDRLLEDKTLLIADIRQALFKYTELAENREDNDDLLLTAADLSCYLIALDEGKRGLKALAYTRLAIHYQNGAIKYDKNNWRKGQPVSRYYDSAMRHLWKIELDYTDEDHYAALLWNLIAIIQTKIDVYRGILPEELNDFPCTLAEVFGENNG